MWHQTKKSSGPMTSNPIKPQKSTRHDSVIYSLMCPNIAQISADSITPSLQVKPNLWCVSFHMSGGQNFLLPAMDMAKVGGPLLVVVKVFAQIWHPKSIPYYFRIPIILSVAHMCFTFLGTNSKSKHLFFLVKAQCWWHRSLFTRHVPKTHHI